MGAEKKAFCPLRLLPSVAINFTVLLCILYTLYPKSTAQIWAHNRYLIHSFSMNINVRDQKEALQAHLLCLQG